MMGRMPTRSPFAVGGNENGRGNRGERMMVDPRWEWMYKDEKGDFCRMVYSQNMDHITAIVERYKDVIYAWDVVNEVLSPMVAGRVAGEAWRATKSISIPLYQDCR